MLSRVNTWLQHKWGRDPDDGAKAEREYLAHLQNTFATFSGRYVLDHWLSDVYCSVTPPMDSPQKSAYNEGQRAFLHEILTDLDRMENGKIPSDAELEA